MSTRKNEICSPKHYTRGKFSALEVIEDWSKNCWHQNPEKIHHLSNIVKYACRAFLKDDFERNMRKVAYYALRAIGEESKLED